MTRRAWSAALLCVLVPAIGGAQLPVIDRGTVRVESTPEMVAYLEASRLETAGQPAKALEVAMPLLEKTPADARFLSLLERCLGRLDRRNELPAFLTRALARDSSGIGVLAIAVRSYALLRMNDSAARYALRWAALAPNNAMPFREWSEAANEARDRPGALAALQAGRKSMGSPTALAPELAQAHQFLGDYVAATREWLVALSLTGTFRSGAVILLGQAPLPERAVVRRELERAGTPEAKQLLGILLAHWGEPGKGAALVLEALPAAAEPASAVLRDLLEELPVDGDRAVLLARGAVYEAVATRQSGAGAVNSRLDAARAYADGGADRDARRMLALVASDPMAPAGSASAGTLLGVLLAEGRAEEAATTLAQLRSSMGEEAYDLQRRRLALLFVRQGKSERAEVLVGTDSTVAAADLIGRIRLFRGDLASASAALRYAGPFDDIRTQSVSRVILLALLQAVGQDTSVALGGALLALEMGDSAAALKGLEALAPTVRPAGAAETRLLAGYIALALGERARAMALFRAADVMEFPGTAAAARLESARLLAAEGKRDEARTMAERLILDFPESALLPDARRLRDEVRGAIPGGTP